MILFPDPNFAQVAGSAEQKTSENSVGDGFDSIFNSKISEIGEKIKPVDTENIPIVEIKIDKKIFDNFQKEKNITDEVSGAVQVSAESAQQLVNIVSSIRLLEQVLSSGVSLEEPSENAHEEPNITAKEDELIAIKESEIFALSQPESVVPADDDSAEAQDKKPLESEVKSEAEGEMIRQAKVEIQMLHQALTRLLEKVVKGEENNNSVYKIEISKEKDLVKEPIVKVSFSDAVVELKPIEKGFSKEENLYQLDVAKISSADSLPDQKGLKEALHRMANVLNLDANVDQSSSSNLTETIEPLESKKVVFPQLEKAESNVISVKINTENKNEKIILPNSLIKDLNAKALMNSVHVKSVAEVAFEPTVVADNSVTALAKNESPTNMQVESANDEANEAIVIKSKNDDVDLKNEFSLKINRKDVPTNDGVFVKEKSEIPLKVNKTEQPFFENKQNIETPKPNEAVKLVVNNDAIEITEEAMLKIEVKAQVQTQTIDTVKQVSKIPEKAIEGNVPIVPQVYKSDEAEKSNSIVLQRKSFKEKITSANQESVVEMKHQGFEIKGSQIAPAGRLQEHVKQAVLAFDDGVFQDKVSTLEAKDSEISGLDVSQMILDRMVENSENNLEPLEMPVVENEKASLDNMISDKKSIVAPDSHRQDILERINQVVVVQKLIRKVQVQKLITEGVVQLRIDPPELGQLLLKMTVRNNEVSLHITSENQQAKDLILNQKHVFVQNMREAGLDVKTIEVHVGKESSSDFSRESGQQAQQQKFRQPQQAPKFFREEIKMDVDVVKETQQHVNKTHLNMIA